MLVDPARVRIQDHASLPEARADSASARAASASALDLDSDAARVSTAFSKDELRFALEILIDSGLEEYLVFAGEDSAQATRRRVPTAPDG
jgi:hypothetical protein